MAIYTNQLAEASAAEAALNAMEDGFLDAEIGAVVSKYTTGGADGAASIQAPIVSTAAPVHVPSSAGWLDRWLFI